MGDAEEADDEIIGDFDDRIVIIFDDVDRFLRKACLTGLLL